MIVILYENSIFYSESHSRRYLNFDKVIVSLIEVDKLIEIELCLLYVECSVSIMQIKKNIS